MRTRLAVNMLLVVLVLAVAGSVTGWLLVHRREAPLRIPRQPDPKVVAPPVHPRIDERVRIVGYGSARPRVAVDITPQVTGILVERADNFRSGKYVEHRQVLCRIDETDYRLAVERADKRIALLAAQLARLDQEEKNLQESERIEHERRNVARRTVDRLLQLREREAASDNQVDTARETLLAREAGLQTIENQLRLIGPQRQELEAQLASAKVELEVARTDLARCLIRSPVAGRVLECEVEVGERAAAGVACGKLYGTDIMEVPVSIPAGDLEWIDPELLEICKHGSAGAPDERIEALVEWQQPDNGREVTWRGCVERLEAGLEAETRTASLVVRVKNPRPRTAIAGKEVGNPNGEADEASPNEGKPMLEVNMFCRVTVLGKQLAKAYAVPRSAILPDGTVYVVENVRPQWTLRWRLGFLPLGDTDRVLRGTLAKRPVTVARLSNEEAMILPEGGIGDGDRVVTRPIPKPVIGMAVQVIDEPSSSASEEPVTPAAGGPAASVAAPARARR